MLVYYSVTVAPEHPRPDLFHQLELSIRSLRAFNGSIPIVVFAFGSIPQEWQARLADLGTTVYPRPPYADVLHQWVPQGAAVMKHYPLLHKFLSFAELASMPSQQVLYLDCDTFFFGDVARLFERYGHAHCVAREEPTTRRSHYGYDPEYLDEDALAHLARSEGAASVFPFNLGVVLFNGNICGSLANLPPLLLDYAWRFALWMALHPPTGRATSYREAPGIQTLRDLLRAGHLPDDPRRALPYPSANRWIWDQLSLWFALGHVPGLTLDAFSPDDVIQNGEFNEAGFDAANSVLCHYFSHNSDRLKQWLQRKS